MHHLLFVKPPRAKRLQTAATAATKGPWTSSFRMTLFPLARSVTNRRADGAVLIIRNQRLVSSLNHQNIVGPSARHFRVIRVICGF